MKYTYKTGKEAFKIFKDKMKFSPQEFYNRLGVDWNNPEGLIAIQGQGAFKNSDITYILNEGLNPVKSDTIKYYGLMMLNNKYYLICKNSYYNGKPQDARPSHLQWKDKARGLLHYRRATQKEFCTDRKDPEAKWFIILIPSDINYKSKDYDHLINKKINDYISGGYKYQRLSVKNRYIYINGVKTRPYGEIQRISEKRDKSGYYKGNDLRYKLFKYQEEKTARKIEESKTPYIQMVKDWKQNHQKRLEKYNKKAANLLNKGYFKAYAIYIHFIDKYFYNFYFTLQQLSNLLNNQRGARNFQQWQEEIKATMELEPLLIFKQSLNTYQYWRNYKNAV